MKRVSKIFACLSLLAVLALPLAACNTMEGVGRDFKAAGDAITGTAQDNKGY